MARWESDGHEGGSRGKMREKRERNETERTMDRAVRIWDFPSLQIMGGSKGVIRGLRSITSALIDTNRPDSTLSLHIDYHLRSVPVPPLMMMMMMITLWELPLRRPTSTAVRSVIRHSAPVLEEGCYPWSSALPAQRDVIRTWAGKLQRLLSVRKTGVAFTHRCERAHTLPSVKLLRATEKHT